MLERIASSLLAAVCTASVCADVSSTFDLDDEGWDTINDVSAFTWTNEFTTLGGSIRATDAVSGAYWFFSAPEAYLGDKSSYLGGEVSWDIYGIQGSQSVDNRADLMLSGGGLNIGINIGVEPVNGQWTSWSVLVDASEDWRIVSSTSGGSLSSTVATPEQIEAVLADLTGFYIRGEYTVGADSTAIDNVLFDAPPCGDVTGDGDVDLADLNLVLANFGLDTDDGDANGDGTVDLADLNLVLGQFGGSC